jgi:hypothetical protein
VPEAVGEHFGVGEEQRGVPAEEHQAGDALGVGVAGDVVVALHVVDPAQDGVVGGARRA